MTPFELPDIREAWLAGGRIAMTDAELLAAFNRVEHYLSRDWPGFHLGSASGPMPTLAIACLGRDLAILDRASGWAGLVAKLQQQDFTALAEVRAAAVLSGDDLQVQPVFEPQVAVGGRKRVPDFALRRAGSPDVHVEVTSPDQSQAEEDLKAACAVVQSEIIERLPGCFDVEIFLLRQVEPCDIKRLLPAISGFCKGDSAEVSLPDDVGKLYRLGDRPGVDYSVQERPFPNVPRIGSMSMQVEGGIPVRRIVIRTPFIDRRAGRKLDEEAGQLPGTTPNLVVLDTTRVSGTRHWAGIIAEQFQLEGLYHDVSEVAIFNHGYLNSGEGPTLRCKVERIENPLRAQGLPTWLESRLRTVAKAPDGEPS